MDIKYFAVGLIFTSCLSYSDGLHNFWINKTHENFSKIKNYQAEVSQQGIHANDEVVTDVSFRPPSDFHIQVSQPQGLAGISMSYQDNSLLYYYPNQNYALKIDGLTAPEPKQALQRVKDMYWFNHEHYERTFTPSIEVADRISVGLDLDAKENNFEIKKSTLFIDYDYSIVMQGKFLYKDGTSNSISHNSILFNSDTFNLPTTKVSKATQVDQWNFKQKSINKEKLVKSLPFDVVWPDETGMKWALSDSRYYLNKQKAAAAGYFYNENYFLVSTVEKDSPALSIGAPLKLSNKVTAHLMQSPSMSSIEFRLNDTDYRLLSNIHAEDLITIARNMVN